MSAGADSISKAEYKHNHHIKANYIPFSAKVSRGRKRPAVMLDVPYQDAGLRLALLPNVRRENPATQ